MNRLTLVALLLAAAPAQAKDFTKGGAGQPAPIERTPATAPALRFQQTEQLQKQFPEGTTCHFNLTREQLQAMKPGEFYVPAGNVIWCRQPFDRKRPERPLHT